MGCHDIGHCALVQVAAHPGGMREQVVDGHGKIDQVADSLEHAFYRRIQCEPSFGDERHHRERGEPLRSASDRKLRVESVRRSAHAIGEASGSRVEDALCAGDVDDPRQISVIDDAIEA